MKYFRIISRALAFETRVQRERDRLPIIVRHVGDHWALSILVHSEKPVDDPEQVQHKLSVFSRVYLDGRVVRQIAIAGHSIIDQFADRRGVKL
jgi:hypothetical protein